jgi:hypothetical protein
MQLNTKFLECICKMPVVQYKMERPRVQQEILIYCVWLLRCLGLSHIVLALPYLSRLPQSWNVPSNKTKGKAVFSESDHLVLLWFSSSL